jgi:UrcA family protein
MTGLRLRMTAGVAAMALAGVLSVGAAKAQPYDAYDAPYDAPYDANSYGADTSYTTTTEGITVYAPRRHYGNSTTTGAPIEAVRESRVVYARDLDLSTDWGARTLRRRIEHAARDACGSLDARYPITEDSPRDCYDGAVHGAMRQVEYRLGFTPPTWSY